MPPTKPLSQAKAKANRLTSSRRSFRGHKPPIPPPIPTKDPSIPPKDGSCSLTRLPNELLIYHLIPALTFRATVRLGQTCRSMNHVVADKSIKIPIPECHLKPTGDVLDLHPALPLLATGRALSDWATSGSGKEVMAKLKEVQLAMIEGNAELLRLTVERVRPRLSVAEMKDFVLRVDRFLPQGCFGYAYIYEDKPMPDIGLDWLVMWELSKEMFHEGLPRGAAVEESTGSESGRCTPLSSDENSVDDNDSQSAENNDCGDDMFSDCGKPRNFYVLHGLWEERCSWCDWSTLPLEKPWLFDMMESPTSAFEWSTLNTWAKERLSDRIEGCAWYPGETRLGWKFFAFHGFPGMRPKEVLQEMGLASKTDFTMSELFEGLKV